jgi:hypothetical protein
VVELYLNYKITIETVFNKGTIVLVFVEHGFNLLWLKFGWSSVCCICTNYELPYCANGSVPADPHQVLQGTKI